MLDNISLLTRDERDLFRKLKKNNPKDLRLWTFFNIVFPFVTLISACIVYKFSGKPQDFISYSNLILNGSLPLIALNLIASTAVYLFKFDEAREKTFGIETKYLRPYLMGIGLLGYLLAVVLFSVQVNRFPFNNETEIIEYLLLSVILFSLCLYSARKMFLLQNDIMVKTFDSEINKAKKSHIEEIEDETE